MVKKSFKMDNPALAFISGPTVQVEQEEQHTQEVHDVQHVQDVPMVQGTQGRKGQKHPRINMAFPADNLEFLQLVSRIDGVSITEYVNRLIAADKAARAQEIERAKGFLKGAKK